MKKIRFLFTILVCITISTSAAYAQNDKFSKSRSGSFSLSSSNKSSTSKISSSSSSNKSSKSSSGSKSSSFSSSRSSSPRSSSSYSSSRNNSSAPKTSHNNSFSTSRSTATSPKQRNTDTGYNSSRSSQKTSSSSTFSSKQKSQTASSPSQATTRTTTANINHSGERLKQRTRTATANINHSRERLKQRTQNYMTATKASTSGTAVNNSSTSAAAAPSQPRASNFVYSPLKNSVMKMLPTKSSAKSSPRQMTHSGLWSQCANNWAGNQSTNKSLVQSYAKQNLNMELIDYGFSGGVLYVIANDSKGTFLQACNQNGTVLDEQEVLPDYCTIFTSEENSGCWIMKRNDADPLYYCFDGTHLAKYTPDEGKDIIDLNFCEMVTYTITRENQHTYFQIYNETDLQPLASTEIDGDYNTIDVEASECRCYIKDPENNQAAEMIWLGDEIMMMEGE